MPYSFGYSDYIEIPELDAFIAELQAVCERHGIGFEWDCGYEDESSKVIPVPIDRAEWGFLTEHLDEYRGGVPFLDEAKVRWERQRDARYEANSAKERARQADLLRQHEEHMKSSGIRLSDGVYRLVKD